MSPNNNGGAPEGFGAFAAAVRADKGKGVEGMTYTKSETDAIQAMVTAFYMCNAAQSPIGGDSGLAWQDSDESPMGRLSQAITESLCRIGFSRDNAVRIWDEIVKNGEGVEYNIDRHMRERSE